MSYILEALKKSQQERELGHVPRLQAITFDDRPAQVGPHRWVYAALFLALVAMAIALYAVLRSGQGPNAVRSTAAPTASSAAQMADADMALVRPTASSVVVSTLSDDVAAVTAADVPAAERRPPQSALQSKARLDNQKGPRRSPDLESQRLIDTESASPRPMASRPARALEPAPGLDAPESLSVQSEVLVVPAPPKPGQPLPRGADELRRAVLGDNPSLSVASLPPSRASRPAESSLPDNAPVPRDLIADIEAFKREVAAKTPQKSAPRTSESQSLEPSPSERKNLPKPVSVPRSAAEPDAALPPPASLALRGKLPPFSMSVHIYDVDPARRFIYINGLKLREQGQSREGIKVERIVAEGAVLNYGGEPFFMPR